MLHPLRRYAFQGIVEQLYPTPSYWLTVLLVVTIALLPRVLGKGYTRFTPRKQALRRQEREEERARARALQKVKKELDRAVLYVDASAPVLPADAPGAARDTGFAFSTNERTNNTVLRSVGQVALIAAAVGDPPTEAGGGQILLPTTDLPYVGGRQTSRRQTAVESCLGALRRVGIAPARAEDAARQLY